MSHETFFLPKFDFSNFRQSRRTRFRFAGKTVFADVGVVVICRRRRRCRRLTLLILKSKTKQCIRFRFFDF